MGRFETTLRELEMRREESPAVVVGFSGGKDSMVVLDLCARTFDRVEAFFMYLVPGLECIDVALAEMEARYAWCNKGEGIRIRQYPHWLVQRYLAEGLFCNPRHTMDDIAGMEWSLRDVYDTVAKDFDIPVVATGAKLADSMWRRWQMASWCKDLLQPLREWGKLDVLAYLKARNLPIPESSGRAATGIDFSTPSLCWLHETYPEDFKRLCNVFPYAEAVIWRKKWYGVGE